MGKHITIYYLLFVLLVMGSFASMAQNNYGIYIMGFVAAGFSLLFLIQFFSIVAKGNISWVSYAELASLSVLASILTLRIFYIHFDFVEALFMVSGLILIVVYIQRLLQSWRKIGSENKKFGFLTIVFYGSIIFYLLSMITVPFWPFLAEPFGGMGFFLVLVFILLGIQKSVRTEDGEKFSALDYVSKFKDRSVLLIFLFLLFTAYMGLTKIGVIPKMYSDEYPQAYFELVNRAESGKEKPEDGKYKHQEFKEAYTRFIERSSTSN